MLDSWSWVSYSSCSVWRDTVSLNLNFQGQNSYWPHIKWRLPDAGFVCLWEGRREVRRVRSKCSMKSCWDGSPVARRIETSRGCGCGEASCIQRLLPQDVARETASSVGQAGHRLWVLLLLLLLLPLSVNGGEGTSTLLEEQRVYWEDWASPVLCSGWLQSIPDSVFHLQESVSHRVSEPAEQRETLSLSPARWWPMQIKGASVWTTCLASSFSVATL